MYLFEVLGIHLGYPRCCIAAFDALGGALGNPKGAEAGEHTGFIPCPTCTDKVLSKEIALKDLIVNREHPNVFPIMKHEDLPEDIRNIYE